MSKIDRTTNHLFDIDAAEIVHFGKAGVYKLLEAVDTELIIRDTEANLSDYDPKAGAEFHATDTAAKFRGDGSSWSQILEVIDVVKSGDGAQTTFTVSHSLGVAPSDVQLTPTDTGSNASYYVTNKTTTSFDIVFATAPGSGTDNVAFDARIEA